MTMRLQLAISIKCFLDEIAQSATGCLPVLILPGHEDDFVRAVGKEFSPLLDRDEMDWTNLTFAPIDFRDHGVIGYASDLAVGLARRYAEATGRPFAALTTDFGVKEGGVISDWESATVILPINIQNTYDTLLGTRHALQAHMGSRTRIGFLAGEDLELLSWLLLKQLRKLCQSPERTINTPHVYIEQFRTGTLHAFPVEAYGSDTSSADVHKFATDAKGVLLLNGHARMHCGIFSTPDGPLALCGSPTGGEQGRCFNDKHCFFEDRPKLLMQSLHGEQVFYNSCFTVKFADASFGVPRGANLGLAALRGSVAQLIGNYRMGHYSEWDIYWFIALSALTYTPAAAVEIIQSMRRRQHRQAGDSLLFVGDAATPAWGPFDLPKAEVTVSHDGITLEWACTSTITACSVTGTKWAQLAGESMLDVLTPSQDLAGNCHVSITEDEENDRTLVLMLLPDEYSDGRKISLRLKPRNEPINLKIGDTLASAIRHVTFIARCNLFHARLEEPARRMTEQLISLRGFFASSDDLLELESKVEAARHIENKAASSVDALMVDIASEAASSGRWNWEDEYADSIHFKSLPPPQKCPLCECLAYQYLIHDLITCEALRRQTVCVECGMIDDLPLWSIEARLGKRSPEWDGITYCEELELKNLGTVTRDVVAQLRINSFNDTQSMREEKQPITLPPGNSVRIELPIKVQAPLSGFYRVRVHLASLGEFGFVARPFVF